MRSLAKTLSRWFLPLLAILSVGTTLLFVGLDPDHSLQGALLEGAFALVLAGVLFAVGYRYVTTTDHPETDAYTIAVWTLAGFGLFAVMNVWFRFQDFVSDGIEPQFIVVTTLTAGILGGAVVGIFVAGARRRHAEREQALADYHEIFEKSEDGIAIIDPETGRILEVNERGAQMLEYTSEELEGVAVEAISADSPDFSHEQAIQKMQRAMAGESQQFDWLLEQNDGSTLWVEVALKQTTIGNERRLIGLTRDISERKEYERELEWADQRFRSLAESTTFGVVTIDETSTVQYANNALEGLLGYEPDALVGDPITTIMPERFRAQHEAGLNQYLDEGTRHLDWSGIELPGRHKDGHEVPLEISFGELESGSEQLFTGILRDVTERKRYEEELSSRSEALETSIDGMALLDENGEYRFVNQAHAAIYGYEDPETLLGEGWQICYSDDELARFEEEVLPTLFEEGSWRGEATGTRTDGSTFPQELSLTATSDGGIVCVVRDVTERHERERAISALHDVTREMMNVTTEEEVCEIAVRTATDILDQHITVVGLVDDTERVLRPTAATPHAHHLVAGEMPPLGPGSLAWEVFESGEMQLYDDVREHSNVANLETKVRGELILPLGAHGVMSIVSEVTGPFDSVDVSLAQILAANTEAALDSTERERELRTRTDQMEFFNSILRHDVLNGMTVIRARAEFLTDELEGDQLRDAQAILAWSDDVVEVIQRVRKTLDTLTGRGDLQLQPVELSQTLREELARVRETYPEVTVETTLPPSVRVQATDLLGEVVGNIVTNAIEHNDTDGLALSITVDEGDEVVTIRIADNGQGVPDDRKERIFRRGETGHAKSTGSGFGLFFADSMIVEYGGSVWVEDNERGGATFVVELRTADPLPTSMETP